jgi:diguanylate cyclase
VVNDVAGHDAGDDVLRHVARLLESQVRQIGWAARLGGDEFAVVLPGCSLVRGQALAEQLRAAVQAWEPSYQGRSFTLGVSIGLVVLDASLQDVPSVLYAADMACYDAKRAGRNRVETRHADQAAASGRYGVGAGVGVGFSAFLLGCIFLVFLGSGACGVSAGSYWFLYFMVYFF